jgi:photosystem II stability/assembly factor-like uncharacterized protein
MTTLHPKATVLLFALTGLFLTISCNQIREINKTPKSDRLAEKHFPNDHFFLQRAYPDLTFDLAAYENGLRDAMTKANQRNGNGFDGEWTVQGPANIGARANTVAVHPTDENILLTGFSSGGIWKTIDGGANWYPVFDDKLWTSIGDIVFDPNQPGVVYAGTGDPNISFYPMLGDGVYKSTDNGETWKHIGLSEQRVISKIVPHPSDPKVLFAASMGLPFVRNNLRGLYKTSDGGATWQQVLLVSDQAGITDVVMDPFNPNVLYASGWDRIRTNQESLISGPGAKVYKSTDGGNTWSMLQNGLPQGNRGRTALAISKLNPGVVYVRYVGTNADLESIYKTTDAGNSWSPIDVADLGGALGGFGWYFGTMALHPQDDEHIYILGVELWERDPVTGYWNVATPPWWEYDVHADKHDITFSQSGALFLATDGGLYKSPDGGFTWEDIENIPTTQFYRVAFNPHQPDLYYGGAQDNGTSAGNAEFIDLWQRIYGGDGFQAAFRPDLPDVMYAEAQNGNIVVSDDAGNTFFAADDGIESADRRNWDMPYIISPHNPDVMYAGTFRMYRSVNGVFPFFEAISEDLTDGVVFHPRHHNVTTISESPLEEFLLYVGTADGNVWRTPDSGGTWENVSNGLPDRYVTEVKASPSNTDWVYVSHSGYRDNENIPRLHRSTNRGDSWEDISSDLPNLAINDLYILPGHADSVLFVATDGGVYGSIDAGVTWNRLGTNLPFVPVFDLEWNPAKNEIFAGTFARSIMSYSIDSLLKMEDDTVSTFTPRSPFGGGIRLFPSPAVDELTLEFGNPHPTRPAQVVMLNIQGKAVYRETIAGGGKVTRRLDVRHLPPGVYVIKLKAGHVVRSGKFVKR